MRTNIFYTLIKKILWRFSRPVSKLLFITHKISYENPLNEKPFASSLDIYKKNFDASVSIDNNKFSSEPIFLEYGPKDEFIKDLAFDLHNVLKDKNSYIHGYALYSYLSKYLNSISKSKEGSIKSINIIDFGTARGFSSLCMAKVLKDFDYIGKIFTFDIIPNRYKFYWNSPSDINFGKQTRLSLLNPWIELVNRYLIFLSTATFNSLRVIDIPEIHFVYVDGCHDFKDVFNEIEYLLERLCKINYHI